jgi:uncharacterized protein YegL
MRSDASMRLAVTPAGHDDIGSILVQLGSGYPFHQLKWKDLEHFSSLDEIDVLFANCEGTCSNTDTMSAVAPHVRRWIERGGSLYASCWAATLVEAVLGDAVSVDTTDMVSGSSDASVLDAGLAEFLGARVIDLDLCGWWPTQVLDEGVCRPLIEGPVPDSDDRQCSLLWEAKLGEGRVIYTAFHNSDQTSHVQKKLLEYLVLRPVLARAMGGAQRILAAERCTPGREAVGTLSRSANAKAYEFTGSGSGDALFLLHWNGTTQLSMTVTDPQGATRFSQSGPAPLRFTAPATAGIWRCTVKAATLPHDNFPFVLTIATRNQGTAPGSPATTLPPPVRPQAATHAWELSLLIDCSSRASDFAPAIGQGLSCLLRNLRAAGGGAVAPTIAIVPWRNTAPQTPHTPLSAMAPVNLACQGELSLGVGADWMRRALAARAANAKGKPMMIAVLASEPSDASAESLHGINAIAASGQANVVAVGVGPTVKPETVRALAPLALRVASGSTQETTACFQWLSELSAASIRAIAGSGAAFAAPALPAGTERL